MQGDGEVIHEDGDKKVDHNQPVDDEVSDEKEEDSAVGGEVRVEAEGEIKRLIRVKGQRMGRQRSAKSGSKRERTFDEEAEAQMHIRNGESRRESNGTKKM